MSSSGAAGEVGKVCERLDVREREGERTRMSLREEWP